MDEENFKAELEKKDAVIKALKTQMEYLENHNTRIYLVPSTWQVPQIQQLAQEAVKLHGLGFLIIPSPHVKDVEVKVAKGITKDEIKELMEELKVMQKAMFQAASKQVADALGKANPNFNPNARRSNPVYNKPQKFAPRKLG